MSVREWHALEDQVFKCQEYLQSGAYSKCASDAANVRSEGSNDQFLGHNPKQLKLSSCFLVPRRHPNGYTLPTCERDDPG